MVVGVHRRMFLKRRWETTAPDGLPFVFDLEDRLPDGAVVHHANGRDYIIAQLPELVYEIEFHDASQAAGMAWKLGNLHLPVEVFSHGIRALHDPATLELLRAENWRFTEREALFRPLRIPPHRTSGDGP